MWLIKPTWFWSRNRIWITTNGASSHGQSLPNKVALYFTITFKFCSLIRPVRCAVLFYFFVHLINTLSQYGRKQCLDHIVTSRKHEYKIVYAVEKNLKYFTEKVEKLQSFQKEIQKANCSMKGFLPTYWKRSKEKWSKDPLMLLSLRKPQYLCQLKIYKQKGRQ